MIPPSGQIDLRQAFRLLEAGQVAQAEAMARQVRAGAKKNPLLHALLGQIAETKGQLEDAARHYQQSIKLDARQPMTHVAICQVRTNQGRFSEAITSANKALRLHPGLPHAIAALVNAYEKQGDHERAYDALRAALECDTPPASQIEVMHATLLMNLKRHEEAVQVAQLALARSDLDPNARHLLGFVLGRSLETLQRYDDSFAAYQAANRVVAAPFDPAAFVCGIDELISVFSEANLRQLPRATNATRQPVFIAGMPRSGTTLIERILDAHPQVRAAGEITVLHAITHDMPVVINSDLPYARCVLDLDQRDVDRLAGRYLEGTRIFGRGVKHVTDKNLQNWRQLGLIHVLFPGATIVHARRDPLDTCFSCFASALSSLTNPWAGDLEAIGLVYRQYERLMGHWQSLLELPILDVGYEALIAEQEVQSRRLIDFAGLTWDESTLRFFESSVARSGGVAPTLSYDQVRKPIYTSSIGRSDAFGRLLDPLRTALDGGRFK